MGTFASEAARFRDAADRADANMAYDMVEPVAETFLRILKSVTPVETGRLRDSETIESVSGGGAHATAIVSPNTVYARFRNDGGTITARNFPQLGNPEVGFFGKSVTQAGSHYMERGQDAAQGPCHAVAQRVVDTFTATI